MSTLARLKDLALSESGFVFDPYTGATFTANATGLAVLRGLRDGLSRAQIVDRLRAEFRIEEAASHLDSDVGDFLRMLAQQALVPPAWTHDPSLDATSTPVAAGGRP
jgi:hypothetical protein